jgi:hypothetical protein
MIDREKGRQRGRYRWMAAWTDRQNEENAITDWKKEDKVTQE